MMLSTFFSCRSRELVTGAGLHDVDSLANSRNPNPLLQVISCC